MCKLRRITHKLHITRAKRPITSQYSMRNQILDTVYTAR